MRKQHVPLLIFVVLTLIFFGTRLLNLSAFPPFIDESFHIHMAERIAITSSPLEQLGEGRQFTAWWYLLFQAYQGAPIWIARAATVIATTISFAAFVALARMAAGIPAMIFTGMLLIFSPYHYFFERLALADSIAGATTALAIAAAYRLRKRVRLLEAMIVGVACFIAFGAKVNTLVFYGIPIAAALTLPARAVHIRPRVIWTGIALGTAVGLLALFAFVARSRGLGFYDGLIGRGLSGDSIDGLLNQLTWSIISALDWLTGYFDLFVFLFFAACVLLFIRRQYYVLLVFIFPALAMLISQRQDTRFWITPIALLITIGGIALAQLNLSVRWRSVSYIGVTLIGLVMWLPFALPAWTDPASMPLPQTDYRQYLMADGAGTGFQEVFARLAEQPTVTRVIGVLPNCQAFRYMGIARQFAPEIVCPPARADGQDEDALTQLMNDSRENGVYVLLDSVPYVPEDSPGRLIASIIIEARGLQRPTLRLYDLAP